MSVLVGLGVRWFVSVLVGLGVVMVCVSVGRTWCSDDLCMCW